MLKGTPSGQVLYSSFPSPQKWQVKQNCQMLIEITLSDLLKLPIFLEREKRV
jgi:hypothetical protein